MNKETFSYILDEISPFLKQSRRGTAISKTLKLATTLRFLVTGTYQRGIGNEYFSSMSQTKVCEVIDECLTAMQLTLCKQWITLNLSSEEEMEVKREFLQKFNMPGVVGCVDGTHIKIMGPNVDERHLYYNRKGYYSLNAMVVSRCFTVLFFEMSE